ncbi:MAG: hypothetical protein GF328_03635, partial [Candidatus Latescibacteria bacterium]|nr:hypothetical protein [Candidatus Latescibacterota bacterium]
LLMGAVAESDAARAEAVLRQGAGDPSWAVRQMAARGLGRSISQGPFRPLAALCRDPSWRVRAEAAHALRRQVSRGAVEREEGIAELLRLLDDPDTDVRRTALVGLGLLRAPEARAAFLEGYAGEDEELRSLCFASLLRMEGGREELLRTMEKALSEPDDRTFLDAAAKYAELAGAKILEEHEHRLLQYLRISPGRCAKVFEEIGRPAVPVLLRYLREHFARPGRLPTNGHLSRTVLDTVQKILGEDAVPVLEEILTEWTEALPAQRYAANLARLSHAESLAPLFARLFDEARFADLRISFLKGLAAADVEGLEGYLRSALLSGERGLQKAAEKILLGRRDIDLSDAILEAIEAERDDWMLVGDLMLLLYERERPELLDVSIDLLHHPDPEFRAKGAQWMEVGEDPDAVLREIGSVLEREDGSEAGGEPDPALRVRVLGHALRSARECAGNAAVPLLVRAAKDEDPVVREKALTELTELRDPRALPLVLQIVDRETESAPLTQAWRLLVSFDTQEVRRRVERELEAADERSRLRVLRALGEVEGAFLPRAVVRALFESGWDEAARLEALDVLTASGGEEHLRVLARVAKRDPVPEIRAGAVRALGEMRSPGAAAVLLGLLPGEEEDLTDLGGSRREVVHEAILALGHLGARDAATPLLCLLEQEWPLALADTTPQRHHVAAANLVVQALGRIGDERALGPLIRLLFTPELHRDFARVEGEPPLSRLDPLTVLVRALVRFPDSELARSGREVLSELCESGDAYRIDEGYLG